LMPRVGDPGAFSVLIGSWSCENGFRDVGTGS
jgi:hypothetical protein